jgi:hypothetical protein
VVCKLIYSDGCISIRYKANEVEVKKKYVNKTSVSDVENPNKTAEDVSCGSSSENSSHSTPKVLYFTEKGTTRQSDIACF